jgi:hypothetical protein
MVTTSRSPSNTRQIFPGVVGYLRVSTEEQADSGLGLAAQEAASRQECERGGLEILSMHTDAGLSGKSLQRPALSLDLSGAPAWRRRAGRRTPRPGDTVLNLSANRHRTLGHLIAEMDENGVHQAVVHAEHEFGDVPGLAGIRHLPEQAVDVLGAELIEAKATEDGRGVLADHRCAVVDRRRRDRSSTPDRPAGTPIPSPCPRRVVPIGR